MRQEGVQGSSMLSNWARCAAGHVPSSFCAVTVAAGLSSRCVLATSSCVRCGGFWQQRHTCREGRQARRSGWAVSAVPTACMLSALHPSPVLVQKEVSMQHADGPCFRTASSSTSWHTAEPGGGGRRNSACWPLTASISTCWPKSTFSLLCEYYLIRLAQTAVMVVSVLTPLLTFSAWPSASTTVVP